MRFPLNIYLCSGIGAGLVAALALPLWRTHCRRIGLVDRPGHRKIHAEPMPLAGGLAVWTAFAISLLGTIAILKLGWLDDETIQKGLYGLSRRRGRLMAFFFGATGMMI